MIDQLWLLVNGEKKQKNNAHLALVLVTLKKCSVQTPSNNNNNNGFCLFQEVIHDLPRTKRKKWKPLLVEQEEKKTKGKSGASEV